MSIGFVKLHRQITEWEWYSDINTTRLFLHLLVTSNFKDKKWRGLEIKRGQIITSLQNLSEETSLSVRSIRTSLNKLKSTGEVTCKTTNRFSRITLTNYDSYQDKESITTRQTTRQETNKRQSNDNQTTTTKEGKEGKEGKKIKTVREKKSKSALKFNDFQIQVAKQLGEHIKIIKNVNLTMGSIKRWANDIRLLQDNDLKPRANSEQDIINVMQSILDNTGKEYFPQVECGAAFRAKFTNVENYSATNNKSRLGF